MICDKRVRGNVIWGGVGVNPFSLPLQPLRKEKKIYTFHKKMRGNLETARGVRIFTVLK